MPDGKPDQFVWSWCLEIDIEKCEAEGWEVLRPRYGTCAVYGFNMNKYVMRARKKDGNEHHVSPVV